jgi:hypothetical protein
MSEQQTYKAKGTSLVVLILLFLVGLGNKACISVHIPAKFRASIATTSAPKVVRSTPSAQRHSAPKVLRQASPVTVTDSIDIPSEAVEKEKAPAVAVVKVKPVFGDPVLVPKAPLPKLQSPDPDDELAALTRELSSGENFLLNTVSSAGPDTSSPSKLPPPAAKIAENTGGGYFNSEVQPNMNDQLNAAFTTKILYDSVIASNNKDYVYNTLTLNNTTASKLTLQVIITSPAGWQMVNSNLVDITLEPYASSIIPMRFSPTGSNTSSWQQVRIEYRLNNVVDTRKTYFKMKVQEYAGFKATLPNSNLVLTSYQKNTSIPVYIKNSGNTVGHYNIALNNQLLKLGLKIEVELKPGKDTVLTVPVPLSESQFSMLKKEDVRVTITSGKSEIINLIQAISKVGYLLKDHASAYLDMPLQLEAGAMYQGEDAPIQYYGALYGTMDFNENNHFSMSLRSNTIAQGQTNKNSMMRFDYNGKHIQASLGNIQGAGEFMVDGYGGRVGYQWKSNNKAEVFGMLQSRTGDTKVYGAALQLGLSDRLRLSDALSLSTDNVRQMNSGILNQVLELKLDKGKLSLITGVGAEKNNAPLAKEAETSMMGSSLGYNFAWSSKHLAIISNTLYNSNSYPGVFKGQRLQTHDARWLFGENFLGAFYEYNFRKQNYWLDTMFFQDVFNLRTNNYGVKAGRSIKGGTVSIAAGNQRQLQQGTDNFETSYNYLNLGLSGMLLKKLFFNITSFGGTLTGIGEGHNDKVFVSTTQGNLQYKSFGASFRYDNGPYYYQEYAAYTTKHEDYNRLVFSPFAEVHLLKKSLSVRLQGNYARTMPSDVSTTNMLANVNYAHPKGYDFSINGIVPVNGSSGNRAYVNASFRMRIKSPVILVRKYYNLKLILFKDGNSNGVKDVGEEPVAGQTLSLNGDLFVSDATGVVLYKNTEKGLYKADFGFSSKLKGWIPSNGTLQNFDLHGNRNIEIPYKVSRIVTGKLLVEKDSFSNIKFNPANIKVTAAGEKEETYSTLTDENGEFYFNLPSGNYVITLSELAFSDQFKPVQFSQAADLHNNDSKTLYFEIKQKRRQINIKKKE